MTFKNILLVVVICLILFLFAACEQEKITPTSVKSIAESNGQLNSAVSSICSSESIVTSSGKGSLVIPPVEENQFHLSESMTIMGDPNQKTSSLEEEKYLIVKGKTVVLQAVQTDSGDLTGYCYDHYRDLSGNLYKFYAGTNIFAAYQKNVDAMALGNREVPALLALPVCEDFLKEIGYDVTGFTLEHSNDYSYDFKATYSYFYKGVATTEKLIFHVMADNNGIAYVTEFRACDYGRYSNNQ